MSSCRVKGREGTTKFRAYNKKQVLKRPLVFRDEAYGVDYTSRDATQILRTLLNLEFRGRGRVYMLFSGVS